MTRIEKLKAMERMVANQYKGKTLNPEEEIFTINGRRTRYGTNIEFQQYIAYCNEIEEEQRELLGIDLGIIGEWEEYGVDFRVYLEVIDGKIDNCYIFKYVEGNYGSHGRPQGSDDVPTRKEIEIFKNIMEYATSEYEGE